MFDVCNQLHIAASLWLVELLGMLGPVITKCMVMSYLVTHTRHKACVSLCNS